MCLGIPGQIVDIIDPAQMRARADVDGVRRDVSVALLGLEGPEGVRVGDWVLIHVGFALSKIDEEEARAAMEFLEGIGQAYEDELRALAESVVE